LHEQDSRGTSISGNNFRRRELQKYLPLIWQLLFEKLRQPRVSRSPEL
jgi:hypothetical protein